MKFSELTEEKCLAIKLDVLNRTSYLKLGEKQGIDTNSNVSLQYVKDFLEMQESELADSIVAAYDKIKGSFRDVIPGTNPSLSKYQILWGRIYIWIYLFKKDDLLWKEFLFPLMIDRRVNRAILEDIELAKSHVDTYIDRQNKITELLSTRDKDQSIITGHTTTEKTSPQSQKPIREELDNIFTYKYRESISYSNLIDFLCDSRKTATDAEWARHALVLYDNRVGILRNIPNSYKKWLHTFCDLFGREWKRDYEPKKLRTTKIKSKIKIYLTH